MKPRVKIKKKYIDADKLIAEIERYIKHYEKLNRDEFKNGELYICQELLSFIKSLQQEQPEVEYIRKDALLEKLEKVAAKYKKRSDEGELVWQNMGGIKQAIDILNKM